MNAAGCSERLLKFITMFTFFNVRSRSTVLQRSCPRAADLFFAFDSKLGRQMAHLGLHNLTIGRDKTFPDLVIDDV